jgi:phage-related protein
MAERPDELNENTQTRINEIDVAGRTNAAPENVYLETRSADTSLTVDSTADDETVINEDETSEETEQIREQIEETRSNLGETINAIQEKLSFSNLSGQVKDEVSEHINSALKTAKDSVYDATLGKVETVMSYINKGMKEVSKTDVGRTASQNPLALSLIGLGVGMILVNGFSKKRSTVNYRYDYDRNTDFDRDIDFSRGTDYDRDFDYNRGTNYDKRNFDTSPVAADYERRGISSGGQSTLGAAQNKVGDVAGQAYKSVSSAAGAVSGTVGDVAGKVSDTVSNVAGQAYEQVGNLGSRAKDVAGSAQDQYEYYMDENPLAVGAVALAIGAAVGFAFPSTKAENRLMGETRENLLQKAEETARDAVGKVQQVAGEVVQTVKEEVKNQGSASDTDLNAKT